MLVPLFKQIARCLNSSHFQARPGAGFVLVVKKREPERGKTRKWVLPQTGNAATCQGGCCTPA